MIRPQFVAVALAVIGLSSGCSDYNLVHPDQQVDPPQPGFPVAVCDVTPNPVTPPFQAATWDGSGSYDPDGLALTYSWQLVSQPAGSAVSLPSGSPDNPLLAGFTPDLAGDYVGELTVTNEHGNTATCQATLTATPTQDMWVEMYWQYSGDDMDLHLLAPGGSLRTDQDCYYANCVDYGYGWGTLDWGQQGFAGDDPRLDLDDIPGTGPENINIDQPADGVYTVVVNDYPGSVYTAGNDVTVNIYLGGSLVWTDTRTITGENSDNFYAKIDWATKTVTGL